MIYKYSFLIEDCLCVQGWNGCVGVYSAGGYQVAAATARIGPLICSGRQLLSLKTRQRTLG